METPSNFIPRSDQQALNWLTPTLDLVPAELSDEVFKQAWSAIFYLYPGLHPDDATAHGTELITKDDEPASIANVDPRLILPRYLESGWPVSLAPLAEEAWRRHEAGRIMEDEFYCYKLVKKGIMDRMSGLTGLMSTTDAS